MQKILPRMQYSRCSGFSLSSVKICPVDISFVVFSDIGNFCIEYRSKIWPVGKRWKQFYIPIPAFRFREDLKGQSHEKVGEKTDGNLGPN
jgi:hypothetical protein